MVWLTDQSWEHPSDLPNVLTTWAKLCKLNMFGYFTVVLHIGARRPLCYGPTELSVWLKPSSAQLYTTMLTFQPCFVLDFRSFAWSHVLYCRSGSPSLGLLSPKLHFLLILFAVSFCVCQHIIVYHLRYNSDLHLQRTHTFAVSNCVTVFCFYR